MKPDGKISRRVGCELELQVDFTELKECMRKKTLFLFRFSRIEARSNKALLQLFVDVQNKTAQQRLCPRVSFIAKSPQKFQNGGYQKKWR